MGTFVQTTSSLASDACRIWGKSSHSRECQSCVAPFPHTGDRHISHPDRPNEGRPCARARQPGRLRILRQHPSGHLLHLAANFVSLGRGDDDVGREQMLDPYRRPFARPLWPCHRPDGPPEALSPHAPAQATIARRPIPWHPARSARPAEPAGPVPLARPPAPALWQALALLALAQHRWRARGMPQGRLHTPCNAQRAGGRCHPQGRERRAGTRPRKPRSPCSARLRRKSPSSP